MMEPTLFGTSDTSINFKFVSVPNKIKTYKAIYKRTCYFC